MVTYHLSILFHNNLPSRGVIYAKPRCLGFHTQGAVLKESLYLILIDGSVILGVEVQGVLLSKNLSASGYCRFILQMTYQ